MIENLIAVARPSADCRLMMTAPGIGALTALSYTSMNPANFANSRGAYAGLAARGYQSGEIEDDGHISKHGDKRVRSLLYEAAIVVLTRIRSNSALRNWGLKLKERAAVARASGGFGLDPAIRQAFMASMRTNACLLPKAPQLENQNVSGEARPGRGDVLICLKGQVATADEIRAPLGDRCGWQSMVED